MGEEHLEDDFRTQIKRYKMRGSSGKVNLAVDRLPEFSCRPGDGPHLMGDIAIAPSIDYLEKAYDQAKYGEFSERPYLNVVIPSLVDPSVAPPGKHVVSCFVQYAPYKIKEGPEHWPQKRDAFGDAVVDTLAEYCPTLKDSILHRQVLTPWDLEQEFGLTEGNIFHGELSLEQLLFLRPGGGLGSLQDADRPAVDVRLGNAPRRWLDGRARGARRQGVARIGAGVDAMGRYDVIVIGAGHNGLTTACLLAKRGRKVLVLERADHAGGLAAADEFYPGFHSAGLFHDSRGVRPAIVDALGLQRHGLELRDAPPDYLALGPDRTGFIVPGDPERAADEIGPVSKRDAEQYVAYHQFLAKVRPVLRQFTHDAPVNLVDVESVGAWDLMRKGLRLRRLGRGDMLELLRLPPMCVADWLDEWFETDLLKGTLSLPAVASTFMGPWSPGTNGNLLLLEAAAEAGVKGGGPALVEALVAAAKEAGVEIQTGAEVTKIRVEGGAVHGVVVGDESHEAQVVAAACDPKRVLLDLLPPGAVPYRSEHRIASFRTVGTTAHVLLAVDGDVEFAAHAGEVAFARTGAHLDDVERAFDAVKYRAHSRAPVLDIHVPTYDRPELAPSGKHVVSILVSFAPYDLHEGWTDAARDAFGDRVVDVLVDHAPAIKDRIVGRAVRTPVDIEARYGTTGGHLHHGEHALDQLLIRPIPECVGYRTPVPGLVLCGSGSHPGGGLTCQPGALAANAC